MSDLIIKIYQLAVKQYGQHGMCCDTEVKTVARTPTGEGIAIVAGCVSSQTGSKHQSPVVGPGSGVQIWGKWEKSPIAKRPSQSGRPFKLVAERTGLEPAT
ncbi:hypothetical protein, partial [Aeromonas allosaccharophila]|uniref:hypothetical protein n=1 Tax=Aeromonas allosaccharophila TaxID=656 RepID=UPI003AF6D385